MFMRLGKSYFRLSRIEWLDLPEDGDGRMVYQGQMVEIPADLVEDARAVVEQVPSSFWARLLWLLRTRPGAAR